MDPQFLAKLQQLGPVDLNRAEKLVRAVSTADVAGEGMSVVWTATDTMSTTPQIGGKLFVRD